MPRLGTPSAFEGPRPGAGGEEVPHRGSSFLEAQTPRAPAAPRLPRARPGGVRTPSSQAPKRGLERCAGSQSRLGIQESCAHPDKRLVVGQGTCKSSSARPTLTRHTSRGGCEGHPSGPAESSYPSVWSAEAKACVGSPAGRGNLRARESGKAAGAESQAPRHSFRVLAKGGPWSPERTPPNPAAPSARRDALRPGAGVRPRASLPDLMEL